jgi:DNA invertase Pin-like site-specific DNA recombinase
MPAIGYEPRHPNDRLLLGMKGTMSELELSILRQRSLEALKQKARNTKEAVARSRRLA